NIDVPDVSVKEAKKDLNEKESIYKKASVITKQNRTYNIENVIYRIKNNLPVPSVVLDEFRTELVKYKKQMNQKNIDSYIEKLNSKINSLETSFQSKKVKDKHKKDSQELRQELNKAQQMKFLDDNITDVIAENYKFIKKYPVKKAYNDYKKCKQTYSRLTLKTPLVSQIKGLMEIEDYNNYNDITEETMDNLYKISECYKQYCKNSMLVFNTEENNGIESKVQEPGRDSAQIAYNWALLNKIDSCSLTNWQKLIRILPEGFANEGTIYRQIMQTADLLGQIKDAADTGLENAESIDDINYYLNLAKTAKESRNLLLKSPVEI
ncbi:MAG: hypothetical protein LUG16_04740, partial [Candidatus Gastranaerophilales bacterium]|nr:hypothetical protein [Candidatus Gastranaerophilales bacterium]